MRCPDCRAPISWVPNEVGRRVAIGSKQVAAGSHYLNAKGVLMPVAEGEPGDAPQYNLHFPCVGEAS